MNGDTAAGLRRVVIATIVCLGVLAPFRLSAQAPSKPGVIRGRIVAGDTGRPLRRAQITLTAPELGGLPRATSTDVQGRYELKDLPPGRYTVSVSRSGYLGMRYGQRRSNEPARPLQVGDGQIVERVDFSLPRSGSITGHILDDAGEPMADAIVWAMRPMYLEGRRLLAIVSGGFQGTDDTGQFRLTGLPPGRYYVRAMTRETWTVITDGKRHLMGFSPTFLPGTPTVREARSIDVGVGQQIRDADFALIPGRPANISGVAVDSLGQPLAGRAVGLTVRFIGAAGFGVGGGGMGIGSAPLAPDGSFTFRNVPPGEYELGLSTGNPVNREGETGRMSVIIDGTDIDHLRLITSAGWSVAGQIITEDGTAPSFPPTRARIGSQLVYDARAASAGVGTVNEDWTFSIRAILGPARLFATVPDGWMVKAIRRNDREISEMPLELKSGEQLSDIQVVVTNRVTSVVGQLTDARGEPLPDGTIVIFADDPAKWGAASRFVHTGRPDQQGQYEIKGLPAGEYLAVAVDYVEDGMWNDPEFLESLRRYAQRLTVADASTQTIALKLVSPEPAR